MSDGSKLAIDGGKPVRTESMPARGLITEAEKKLLLGCSTRRLPRAAPLDIAARANGSSSRILSSTWAVGLLMA